MFQAITTKFIGPTNHQGARVKAYSQAGSVIVPWDHALNITGNHHAAMLALVRHWGWEGDWRGGALPNGKGYAFVCVERHREGGER